MAFNPDNFRPIQEPTQQPVQGQQPQFDNSAFKPIQQTQFDNSAFKPVETPDFEPEQWAEENLSRQQKRTYKAFVSDILKPDRSPQEKLSMYHDASAAADSAMANVPEYQGLEMEDRTAIHSMLADQLYKAKDQPGYVPEVGAPEGGAEKAGDFATDVGHIALKFYLFGKLAPAASAPIVFEGVNLMDGGVPGRGLVMGQTLSAFSKIPAKTLIGKTVLRPAAAGSLFAGMAKMEGADNSQAALAFAIPYVFALTQAATGTKTGQMIKMKAQMRKNGFDPKAISKATYDKMWDVAAKRQQLQKDVRAGKIDGKAYEAGLSKLQREAQLLVPRKPVKAKVTNAKAGEAQPVDGKAGTTAVPAQAGKAGAQVPVGAAEKTLSIKYDELLERSQNGDQKATDELNQLNYERNHPEKVLPTHEELLDMVYEGDQEAVNLLQQGKYQGGEMQAEAVAEHDSKLVSPDTEVRMSKIYKMQAHKVAKEIGLDDVSRRQLNEKLTGKESMTEMTLKEEQLVTEELYKLATAKKPQYGKPGVLGLLTSTKYQATKMGIEGIIRPLAEGQSKYRAELNEQTKAARKVIDKLIKAKGIVGVKELAHLLDTTEQAPTWLEGEALASFNYFRELQADLLKRMNESREARGDKIIPDIGAYLRHILPAEVLKAVQAGRMKEPGALQAWRRGVKKIFNPQELERKLEVEIGELFSDDLQYVMESMLKVSLRDIHIAAPHKLIDQILTGKVDELKKQDLPRDLQKHVEHASEMPKETRDWIQRTVKEVFDGEQTALDIKADAAGRALLTPVESILNKFGKTMGSRPITKMLTSLGTLVHYSALGPRPKLIIRNKFQTLQNLALSGARATAKAAITKNPRELTSLLNESTFFADYNAVGWIDEGTASKVGKKWMASYKWSAVSNVKTSMEAAYHATMPLFADPKHKDLGWASKDRTYNEPKDFLYPEERARMLHEMEDSAGASQYGYTLWESPEIFRHKALGPFTKLQSWPMNYWTRFVNEQAYRAFRGTPSWDTSLKLPMSARLRPIQYLMLGGAILNLLGYGRSFLFGTAPSGWPPSVKLMLGVYQYALNKGKSDSYAKSRTAYAVRTIKDAAMMHIPGYLTAKDAKAFLDAANGEKNWSELFFYTKFGNDDDD